MRIGRLEKCGALLLVAFGLVSCAKQQVRQSVQVQAKIEGERYAREVAAQSPFTRVEMSWAESVALMERRNKVYRNAQQQFRSASEDVSETNRWRGQLVDSVGKSMGDVLNPGALVKSIQDPVVGIPKQFGSISSLKDVSHEMEKKAWKRRGDAVSAKVQMREQQVGLFALLSKGEVIDQELARLDATPAEGDEKQQVAWQNWRENVHGQRKAWLQEVRDFFNAEYRDVCFQRNGVELQMYRDVVQPDFSEWQRWCVLSRLQSMIEGLSGKCDARKAAFPGTQMVVGKVGKMLDHQPVGESMLQEEQVAHEVRLLIRHWRGIKRVQAELVELERVNSPSLEAAQNRYRLRLEEIEHARVLWQLDEHCWNNQGLLAGL